MKKSRESESSGIYELQQAVQEFNDNRNWSKYHSPRNLAMAISVEASELLELFLWASDDGPQPPVEGREEKVEEEVGDVLITLLNFCSATGIDPVRAARLKLEKNKVKYPVEISKGRLEKHNEL